MEKGLDTVLHMDLSEDGVDISGGEAQKIVICISHRLLGCKFCDEITMFCEGAGTHAELVASESGNYHERWNAQALYCAEKTA